MLTHNCEFWEEKSELWGKNLQLWKKKSELRLKSRKINFFIFITKQNYNMYTLNLDKVKIARCKLSIVKCKLKIELKNDYTFLSCNFAFRIARNNAFIVR